MTGLLIAALIVAALWAGSRVMARVNQPYVNFRQSNASRPRLKGHTPAIANISVLPSQTYSGYSFHTLPVPLS